MGATSARELVEAVGDGADEDGAGEEVASHSDSPLPDSSLISASFFRNCSFLNVTNLFDGVEGAIGDGGAAVEASEIATSALDFSEAPTRFCMALEPSLSICFSFFFLEHAKEELKLDCISWIKLCRDGDPA